MADAILADRLRRSPQGLQLTVRSAGLHAVAGSPADERIRRLGHEFEVSLDRHSAAPLSLEHLREADLVFVMDRLNEAELLSKAPFAEPKLFLLGELSPSDVDGIEIPDPFTGDDLAAQTCARRIGHSIAVLLPMLVDSATIKR